MNNISYGYFLGFIIDKMITINYFIGGNIISVGAALKKIRKDKGFTQKKLSSDIMSRSNLAKLENNDYFPSFDKFMLVLSRLQVTSQEFYIINNEFKENDYLEKSIGYYLENPNKEIRENKVKTYLSNTETWYNFEMLLFEQYLHLFTTTEIIFWTNFLIQNRKDTFYNDTLVKILLSSSINCLLNKKENYAILYSKIILNSFCHEDYLYETLTANVIVIIVEGSTSLDIKQLYSYIRLLEINLPQELVSLINLLILEEDI